jgi:chemotaxis methyl-accepting protein methylase
MVLREVWQNSDRHITLQLFGTDIDNHAIDKAREGLFPASITADVSEERLRRFFVREGDFTGSARRSGLRGLLRTGCLKGPARFPA